jgi:hypothetical protein
MTDDYLNRFAANWNFLSPKLGLDSFTKEVGNTMRDGINGTRGSGTLAVEIFNDHQDRVFNSMTGKGADGADFDSLKAALFSGLDLDKPKIDDSNYSVSRRDAERAAVYIQELTLKLFRQFDQNLKPADAQRLKGAIVSVFTDVGRMAQSELQAGIAEWALQKQSTASK